jgi:putative restriction endonuclease
MNGAPDFQTMIDRIVRLRGDGDGAGRTGNFQIGCIMVAAPVFFRQEEWVRPPEDWARSGIQQGKTYALDSREGNRLFRECIDRAQQGNHYWNVERIEEAPARYGAPVEVKPRLGQGLFRLAVRDAYRGACAVTGEHSGPVLEAAHIVPYARGGEQIMDCCFEVTCIACMTVAMSP